MNDVCPHDGVLKRCLACLAAHLDAVAAMLTQIRTWTQRPPEPETCPRCGEETGEIPSLTHWPRCTHCPHCGGDLCPL